MMDDNQQEEYRRTPIVGSLRPMERYGLPFDSGYQVNPISLSTQIPDNSFYIDKLKSGKITSQKLFIEAKEGSGDSFIASGKTDFTNDVSGWILGVKESDKKPRFYIGNDTEYLNWDGTNLNIKGNITIINTDYFNKTTDDLDDITDGTNYGRVASTDIFAGHITVVADTASININDTTFGNQGIQLQYNSGTPRAYIGNGSTKFFSFDGTDLNLGPDTTVNGRVASVISSAIDANGHFIDDNLNTLTNTILDSFSFGVSGALQIGTYVNGVTGDIRISPNGIVGRNSAGDNTFAIDGTTGNATFAGTLSAAAGTLGSITAGSFTGITIGIGTGDSIFKADSNGIYLGNATFASAPFRVTMAGDITATSATITGALTTGAGSSIDGQYLGAGTVASASANLAMRGWTFSGTFSSTDADTVTWTAGTFTASDGTAYSILTGNTGNMTALTYIYLDIAVSTTVLQTTTTSAIAVGNGKVLIAVAQNQTSRATFQVFGGSGGETMLVDNLVANSASTNEFVSNSAQLANLVVTDAKINTLAVSKLTAGTISSKAITLAIAAGTGDSYIGGGNNLDLANWRGGDANGGAFILGLDDSVSNDPAKLFIGNYSTSKYFSYDGTDISMIGGTITSGTIQTSTSGQRLVLTGSELTSYDTNGYRRIDVGASTGGLIKFWDQVNGLNSCGQMYGFYTNTEASGVGYKIYFDGIVGVETRLDAPEIFGNDGDLKLSTYSSNITFNSDMLPTNNNAKDLGSSSYNMAEVHTRKIYSGATLDVYASSGDVNIQPSTKKTYFYSAVHPNNDNDRYLGDTTHRWAEVWAANGTIQTSDKSEKKDIKESDLGLDFINKLKSHCYKWKKNNRKQYGLVADELLDDKEGKQFVYGSKNTSLGINYAEFISPLIKAIQELSKENKEIKQQLAELRNKL